MARSYAKTVGLAVIIFASEGQLKANRSTPMLHHELLESLAFSSFVFSSSTTISCCYKMEADELITDVGCRSPCMDVVLRSSLV